MNLAVGGRTYDNWVKKADVIRNKQHPPFSRNMVNASRFKVPKSFTEKVCESMTPSINRTGCPKLIIGIPHKNIGVTNPSYFTITHHIKISGLQTPPTLLSPHKNIGVTNPSYFTITHHIKISGLQTPPAFPSLLVCTHVCDNQINHFFNRLISRINDNRIRSRPQRTVFSRRIFFISLANLCFNRC